MAAVKHKGQPTVILAKTVKGFGMGTIGEGKMATHQQKENSTSRPSASCATASTSRSRRQARGVAVLPCRPTDSPEMKYLHERRRRARRLPAAAPAPRRHRARGAAASGAGRGAQSHGSARDVHHHGFRARPQRAGARQGPRQAHRADRAGRSAPSAWKACSASSASISSEGQKYVPVDRDQVTYYREDKAGPDSRGGHQRGGRPVLLDRRRHLLPTNVVSVPSTSSIRCSGCSASAISPGPRATSARAASCSAAPGRTTLNGEGLQHEDGHSQVFSSVIPNCIPYDPTFGYELAVIVHDGLRRMVDQPGRTSTTTSP